MFDIEGPDSLGFGAACAIAAAPMMTMPARQLVAKTLRFMIHTLFSVRALGAPTPCQRMPALFGFTEFASRIRQKRTSSPPARMIESAPALTAGFDACMEF